MVQPSLRDAQPFLSLFRGLKSTATFIDHSAVTEASIIQSILQATGNKPTLTELASIEIGPRCAMSQTTQEMPKQGSVD